LAATTTQTGTGAGKAPAAKRAATKPRPARRAEPGRG